MLNTTPAKARGTIATPLSPADDVKAVLAHIMRGLDAAAKGADVQLVIIPRGKVSGFTPAAKKAKAAPEPQPYTGMSCAKRIEQLIVSGKTNQQVWAVVKVEYNMPHTKIGYVSWVRANMKRKAAKRVGTEEEAVF